MNVGGSLTMPPPDPTTPDPTTPDPTTPDPTTPDPSTGAPLLEFRNVYAGYGPFRALFDVSFAVRPGSVTALLGSNGAGKTTVARVATGLVRPTSGDVWFGGERIGWPLPARSKRPWTLNVPWRIVESVIERFKRRRLMPPPIHVVTRKGMIHAPEGRSVFASLSVRENLELGFRRELGAGGVNDALARAYELFPRLGERRKQIAGTLSGGEQRMLSLARVMVNPPKLLVADELSLGLAPIVVDEVYRNLAIIRDSGTAILLVEQYVGHALAIADEVAILNHGTIAYSGPATDVDDISQYLL